MPGARQTPWKSRMPGLAMLLSHLHSRRMSVCLCVCARASWPHGLRDPAEGTKRNGFVPREIQYSGLNLNSPLRHPVYHPRNAYMATTCIDFLGKWKIGVEFSTVEWMMYRRLNVLCVFMCLFLGVYVCVWLSSSSRRVGWKSLKEIEVIFLFR